MTRTSLARQAALPVWAAISIGLLACSGGGQSAPTAAPAPNPAPSSPPSPGPGPDPAPPAPEAVRFPMRTMDPGAVVTLVGGGCLDSEDGPLSCNWRQTAGTLRVELRGADACAPQFDAPNRPGEAVLAFTLTTTDAAGAVRAIVIETITVRDLLLPPGAPPPPPCNRPPAADAGGDVAVDEGNPVALDGSGSSDPEGGMLAFSWAQTAGMPSVALSGANTAAPTFSTPQLMAPAVLTFTLTATDAGGQSAADSVTVTVKNVRPANSAVRTPASGETLEPATAKSTASSWKTAEYTASVGLPLINAAEGYAARTTGRPGGGGIIIAVYDHLIHSAHPDLGSVEKFNLGGNDASGTHVTRVAGAAAARRDGTGMHGVAYNANIVDFQAGDDLYALEAVFASMAGLTGTFSYPGYRSPFPLPSE